MLRLPLGYSRFSVVKRYVLHGRDTDIGLWENLFLPTSKTVDRHAMSTHRGHVQVAWKLTLNWADQQDRPQKICILTPRLSYLLLTENSVTRETHNTTCFGGICVQDAQSRGCFCWTDSARIRKLFLVSIFYWNACQIIISSNFQWR